MINIEENSITFLNLKRGEFVDVTISLDAINLFSKSHYATWTKKGDFKKWVAQYDIQVKGNLYHCREDIYKELVDVLGKSFTKEKDVVIEHKGYSERKAIGWTYRRQNDGE